MPERWIRSGVPSHRCGGTCPRWRARETFYRENEVLTCWSPPSSRRHQKARSRIPVEACNTEQFFRTNLQHPLCTLQFNANVDIQRECFQSPIDVENAPSFEMLGSFDWRDEPFYGKDAAEIETRMEFHLPGVELQRTGRLGNPLPFCVPRISFCVLRIVK